MSATEEMPRPDLWKDRMDQFLARVPNSSEVVRNHRQLMEYFAYFVMTTMGEPVATVVAIRACYSAAAVSAPANISDIIIKSGSFVRAGKGYQLHRSIRIQIESSLRAESQRVSAATPMGNGPATGEKSRNVVVVHGRDSRIRDSMFQFLLSLRLNPIDWNEAVQRTGKGSPFTGDVVEALFVDAQSIVVILSPDEHAQLREDLREGRSEDDGWQPRPNVFIEAGMALAKDEAHTILVQIGTVRQASDLLGRNVVLLDNSSPKRNSLVQRLTTAGCPAVTVGNDWLRAGDFALHPRLFAAMGKEENEPRRAKKKIHR